MMGSAGGPVGTGGALPQAPPKPWWTSQLDDSYKKLQNNNAKCIRHKSERNKKLYLESQKRYVQAVQNHQASYTANLIQMVQYCPSGQFWTLRQQQQTSFALPMSPIINNSRSNLPNLYNNHAADMYFANVESFAEESEDLVNQSS